jgi:hypothetical protein
VDQRSEAEPVKHINRDASRASPLDWVADQNLRASRKEIGRDRAGRIAAEAVSGSKPPVLLVLPDTQDFGLFSDILQIGQRGAWPEVNHEAGRLAILIHCEVIDGG